MSMGIFNSKRTKNKLKAYLAKPSAISVNGKDHFGDSIELDDDFVIISSSDDKTTKSKPTKVFVGDQQQLDIVIYGNAKNVNTNNGNIECHQVSGNVSTENGNINCDDVGGKATTENGNIYAKRVMGKVKTEMGDITITG